MLVDNNFETVNYSEYEEWINQVAAEASESSRLEFAYKTVHDLYDSARAGIEEHFSDEEKSAIKEIVNSLDADTDWVREKLDGLDESIYKDPSRKIKYLPNLMEFLCAIAHLLDYRNSGNPTYIAAIGLNKVNVIDYAVSGQVDGYSVSNILVADDMQTEIERQEKMLVAE